METKFIAFYTNSQNGCVEWIGEWDKLEGENGAQAHLDMFLKNNSHIEAGWIVQTVGRNYLNT